MGKEKGITIISLVVTIIVIIILAGTSINILLGENGIITKAKEAKKTQKIAEITEMLELQKGPVQLENEGKVTLETYLEQIIKEGIIEESNIEGTENENAKTIVVDGYVFLVEDEKNGNVKITYQGETGKLIPKLEIKEIIATTNSITVKTEGKRIDKYEFYIKNVETGEEYKLKETNETGEYTFNELEQNKEYQIKVKAKNIAGSIEKESGIIRTVTVEELQEQDITFKYEPEGWTNGTVKVTASINKEMSEGYRIQTSKDAREWSDETSQTYSENGEIYVRIWYGDYFRFKANVDCKVTIKTSLSAEPVDGYTWYTYWYALYVNGTKKADICNEGTEGDCNTPPRDVSKTYTFNLTAGQICDLRFKGGHDDNNKDRTSFSGTCYVSATPIL